MPLRRCLAVLTAPVIAFLWEPVAAADYSIGAELASEIVHRGFAYGDQTPAGLVAVGVDWDNGWFIGAEGFDAAGSEAQSLERGSSWYAGWFKPLANNEALGLSVRRYRFGGRFGPLWDFDEWRADWHVSRRTTVSISYSDDYYGRDAAVWLPEISFASDLSDRVTVHSDLGFAVADRESMFDETWYVRVGVRAAFDALQLGLDLFAADNDIDRRTGFPDVAGTRAVISIGFAY